LTISPKLRERILEANVDVHAAEAAVYELLHSEIYNWYEQRATWSRVSAIDRLVAGHTTRSALDIGCGTGNLLLKFTCLGFDVVGVDVSRQMLDVLSGKGYPADRLLCTDVDSFLENYEGECFDVVAISSVLHHLPDYLDTLSRAVRLLKVGGGLLITHEPLVLMSHTQPELVLRLQKAVSWLASMTFRLTLCLHRVRPPSIDPDAGPSQSSDA
jgi:ubiquinone/menaquinone biosynthesis C-methylase UbiE